MVQKYYIIVSCVPKKQAILIPWKIGVNLKDVKEK